MELSKSASTDGLAMCVLKLGWDNREAEVLVIWIAMHNLVLRSKKFMRSRVVSAHANRVGAVGKPQAC
jgi:hypothetical protein